MESAGFNVISWNVNGLRTINIKETLAQFDCSILGIQETKLASKFGEPKKIIKSFPDFHPCKKNNFSSINTF